MEQVTKSTKIMNWVLRIFIGVVILAGATMGVATMGGDTAEEYQESYSQNSSPF